MRILAINIMLILNGCLFGAEEKRPNPEDSKGFKEHVVQFFADWSEFNRRNRQDLLNLVLPKNDQKADNSERAQFDAAGTVDASVDSPVQEERQSTDGTIQDLEKANEPLEQRPGRARVASQWQTSFQKPRSEQPENDGKNALHLAVWQEDEEEVKRLLDKKQIDVNWRDKEGWTPLHMAAYKGNKKIIATLIKYGAQDVRSKDGTSCVAMAQDDATQEAMFFAWRKRHAQAMLAFHPTLQAMQQFNLGEEEDAEQLVRALALSQQEAEDRKLDDDIDQGDKLQNQKEGSDADEQQLGDGKLEEDIELDPFEKALWEGNLEEVRQLIRSGIDPSQKQFGAIPIIWLAVQRYIDRRGQADEREIIIELINAGADLNVRLSSLFKKKPIFIQGIRTWHINELNQFINDFSEYLPASLLQEAIEEAKKLRERYKNHPASDFSKKISLLEQKYADKLASCEE